MNNNWLAYYLKLQLVPENRRSPNSFSLLPLKHTTYTPIKLFSIYLIEQYWENYCSTFVPSCNKISRNICQWEKPVFLSYFEISDNVSVGAQESAAPTASNCEHPQRYCEGKRKNSNAVNSRQTEAWTWHQSSFNCESLTAVLGIVTLFCCFLLVGLYLSTCMYLSMYRKVIYCIILEYKFVLTKCTH